MPTPTAAERVSMPVIEPTPPEPEMLPNSMDGALADLTPMQARIDAGPAVKKLDKTLDSLGDRVTNLTDQTNKVMTVIDNISTIISAAASTDIAQKIERGIQRFTDDLPWLMKALDEVARIHPVVTVAVLAFKAVYALESTRQENDRRVMTLYVEMKDMMMVMVQLKGVENRAHVGLDGRPLKDRLEELAEKTAKDIKDCANLCDTFVKKKLLVKVFKGPVWAEKLAGFVKVFEDRKADFEFALTMHTANSVSDVKRQNCEIQVKLDAVLDLFNKFVGTEERRIANEIEAKGGLKKVQQDDEALKALLGLDKSVGPQAKDGPHNMHREKTARNKISALDELKVELREDFEDALKKNFDVFTFKFELQKDYIKAESDRVIGAVKDAINQGPHMRIKNEELRQIWKDMGWRGNVKARLFVLTLQDHYRDLFENTTHTQQAETIVKDGWALEYLGLNWLRPLMEAFDDDTSGYVNITEVNKLMDMRPLTLTTWSIPHWLAYWAVGWRVASTSYIMRIRTAIGKMQRVLPRILSRNRSNVDWYLSRHWHEAFAATAGFQTLEDETLKGRFQDYIKHEEDRIRGNLEKIKYNLDTPETVSLVIGSGGLEKCFLILLCLILEHDLRLVRAATCILITEQEMFNAQTTWYHIFTAFYRRFNELDGLFAEQKIDKKEGFKQFAFGLFLQFSPASDIWSMSKLDGDIFAINIPQDEGPITLDGIEEEKKPQTVSTAMFEEVDAETEDDRVALHPTMCIVGEWNGFPYIDSLYPERPMLSLRFHYSKDGEDFSGSGVDYNQITYTLSGKCLPSEDSITQVKWNMLYDNGESFHYHGTLIDEFTITGTRAYGDNANSDALFLLKKIDPLYMTLRPSPSILEGSKYRSLWQYAISATLQDVRRRSWSWSYFAARRDARRKYLQVNYSFRGYISEEESESQKNRYFARLAEVSKSCTAAEARLCESTSDHFYLISPYHCSTVCEGFSTLPKHKILGARCICLTCVPDENDFSRQISFCDDPECLGVAHLDGFWSPSSCGIDVVHRTTHDILKIRMVINHLHWPDLSEKAAEALKLARSPGNLPDPPAPEDPHKPHTEDRESRDEGQGSAVEVESEVKTSISTPKCGICRELVYMGHCWHCLECGDYICDECERQMLIACRSCHRRFPQPEWYYGFKPTDFKCPTCCGLRVEDPAPDNLENVAVRRHVYTHPLVQCKRLVPDPQVNPETEQKTTDSRLAKLEEQIGQLQGKLDEMQKLLLSRLPEALSETKMPSVDSGDGQVRIA